MAETVVDQFTAISLQLIQEAAEYAGSGQQNLETEANIRQLRALTMSLHSAVTSVQLGPPATRTPPTR